MPAAQHGHSVACRLYPHPLQRERSRGAWLVCRGLRAAVWCWRQCSHCWKKCVNGSGGWQDERQKIPGLLAGLVFLAAMPFGTVRAFALESLPGRELWQPYLTQSAQGAADFARDPVSALLSLLPGSPVQLLVDTLHSYADLLLFLLLLTALSFLVGDAADGTLLDLAAAGGCGVLIWGDLLTLAQSIGERMDSWRLFLTGFLPVCGAVLTAGGEGNAGAVASGFLLSVLALLAQGIALCIRPLLQSYLAISMACCIHTQTGLPEACRMSGQLLRKSISAGGKLFALRLAYSE